MEFNNRSPQSMQNYFNNLLRLKSFYNSEYKNFNKDNMLNKIQNFYKVLNESDVDEDLIRVLKLALDHWVQLLESHELHLSNYLNESGNDYIFYEQIKKYLDLLIDVADELLTQRLILIDVFKLKIKPRMFAYDRKFLSTLNNLYDYINEFSKTEVTVYSVLLEQRCLLEKITE